MEHKLREALDLLREDRWTTGAYISVDWDEDGKGYAEDSQSYCALGALAKVSGMTDRSLFDDEGVWLKFRSERLCVSEVEALTEVIVENYGNLILMPGAHREVELREYLESPLELIGHFNDHIGGFEEIEKMFEKAAARLDERVD